MGNNGRWYRAKIENVHFGHGQATSLGRTQDCYFLAYEDQRVKFEELKPYSALRHVAPLSDHAKVHELIASFRGSRYYEDRYEFIPTPAPRSGHNKELTRQLHLDWEAKEARRMQKAREAFERECPSAKSRPAKTKEVYDRLIQHAPPKFKIKKFHDQRPTQDGK